MRRVTLGLALALALVGAAPMASAAAERNDGPQASIACTRAKIGGESKCIAAGQYCAKRYESDYRRYGYTCNNRDRNGRWHLRRR